jgi:hypothetical protein
MKIEKSSFEPEIRSKEPFLTICRFSYFYTKCDALAEDAIQRYRG